MGSLLSPFRSSSRGIIPGPLSVPSLSLRSSIPFLSSALWLCALSAVPLIRVLTPSPHARHVSRRTKTPRTRRSSPHATQRYNPAAKSAKAGPIAGCGLRLGNAAPYAPPLRATASQWHSHNRQSIGIGKGLPPSHAPVRHLHHSPQGSSALPAFASRPHREDRRSG